MEKLNEQINSCLTSLDKLADVREALTAEGETVLSEFNVALVSRADELCYEKATKTLIEALLKGETTDEAKVNDAELMQKCQDEAMGISNEWDETTAKLAVASYLTRGGTIETSEEEANKLVTLGELYNLKEGAEWFDKESTISNKQRKTLPDTIFCGENKTYPVTDKASAVRALKLSESLEGETKDAVRKAVFEAANQFGLIAKEDSFVHTPIMIQTVDSKNEGLTFTPIQIKTVDDAKEALESLPSVQKAYGLEESAVTTVTEFLNDLIANEKHLFDNAEFSPLLEGDNKTSKPLILGNEFLMSYFTKHEFQNDEQTTLAKFVGLVRKEGMTLEKLEEAGKPYQVFGSTVLKHLLTSAPAKTEAAEAATAEGTVVQVTPANTPTISAEEADVKETQKTNESSLWYKSMGTSKGRNNRR